jgi:hypothetical protein
MMNRHIYDIFSLGIKDIQQPKKSTLQKGARYQDHLVNSTIEMEE